MREAFNWEKINGFCQRVCYLFAVNLFFLASNLFLLLFLVFAGVSQIETCLPLFLLCLLPAAPSLCAVFFSMQRLMHQREGKVFKDCLTGWKSCCSKSIKIGAVQLASLFVLWTNIRFFAVKMQNLLLLALFVCLFALVILMTPTLYLLIVRYEMSCLQTIRSAIALTVGKPVFTMGNLAAFLLLLLAFELSAGTTVLFMGSIYGFLICFMNERMLQKLETKEKPAIFPD